MATAYRYVKKKYKDDPISGEGAIKYSGRYGLGFEDTPIQLEQRIKILYLATTEELAEWEVHNQGNVDLDDYVLFKIEYDLKDIIDLTDPDIVSELGLNNEDLVGSWRDLNEQGIVAPTQEIGIAVYNWDNISALLVPSVAPQTIPGFNLVIFPERVTSNSGQYLEAFLENRSVARIPGLGVDI